VISPARGTNVSEIAGQRAVDSETRAPRNRQDRVVIRGGHYHGPALPHPNPWVMAVVATGAGVTLCWLATAAGDGEDSPWHGRPPGLRTYYETTWALGGAFMIVMGLVFLGVAIARL
jgi:hypothetical protein